VERLHAWGVRRIYGYPGDGINGVIGAPQRAGNTEFIQVRHEEMAAFMAVAHAKFTGELGVCRRRWRRATGVQVTSSAKPQDKSSTGCSAKKIDADGPTRTALKRSASWLAQKIDRALIETEMRFDQLGRRRRQPLVQ
jgi:Thiamine pyrophosphate enzyme, N-terminal TPP binding domain